MIINQNESQWLFEFDGGEVIVWKETKVIQLPDMIDGIRVGELINILILANMTILFPMVSIEELKRRSTQL